MYFRRFYFLLFLLTTIVSVGISARCDVVYVNVACSGNCDGSSWSSAYRTVSAGLAAATSGDEVWVATGLYPERITLKTGVGLYGGFAGGETSRDACDPSANPTILDGTSGGCVVTAQSCAAGTVINGFTIRGGCSATGGGIYCKSGSPTISRNIITGNTASDSGGGIYCCASSPVITGNLIVANCVSIASTSGKGGGVYCDARSKIVLLSNDIRANAAYSGGGIYCASSAYLGNNTICANTAASGGGVCCTGLMSPAVWNNIIAFNSSGICKSSSQTLTYKSNCVYGNTLYNYSGWGTEPTGSDGNISVDPNLAALVYGDTHIQPDSPCVNAGIAGDSQSSEDIDNQTRVQDAFIDIGADESDGVARQVTPQVVRVSTSGNDELDGSSWASAKRSVQSAIDSLGVSGGEVWVAAGIYYESVSLKPFAHIYGGFAGIESARSERVRSANVTTIDGSGNETKSVVTASASGHMVAAIDGFTIRGGHALDGGGIMCDFSSPDIRGNTITGNSASHNGGGICCTWSSSVISHNFVTGNSASAYGGGVSCSEYSRPSIINSVVAGNQALSGGGVHIGKYAEAVLTNNTIAANTTAGDSQSVGGGLYLCDAEAVVSNTIIACNSSGIYASDAPEMHCSNISGNDEYDYSWITPAAAENDVLTVSATIFVDFASGNYRLVSTSPCIDTGWGNAARIPSVDMDGNPRIYGEQVDIGAYEYQASEAAVSSIVQARQAQDGCQTDITGALISAAFANFYYIESDDRLCGIRVEQAGHDVNVGDRVDISGVIRTNADGERYIEIAVQ
ncbi:MAG: choice-of-anchor Q domain-containing protein [Armatimonadota bacterium]|nr:DUF1565 domain-containing protein [bacterium]